ncbi:HI0074 family nucleotidyltransferase substrate-binding subunit [Anaerovibrio slackiae]|uniref:HI0074 family nucleotidyltransferase substrate-binding subunit n=1 Tax=Anaerovibrio slackiae TaxID=2652309 RepID=UPI003F15001C
MNDMRLRSKYEKYHRAINSLRVAVQWAPDDGNMYLDATIQRFEFCFELSWRLMRSVLAYEGIYVSTPRGTIREGWKLGLIDDAEKWLDMLEKRKLSAHVYNEVTAMDIYQRITDDYVELLSVFEQRMKERIAFY